ncbi:hypothetical protein A3Q56_06438 [Intoshia linei]|uniref:ENTH domain-containing protein n=1 Tax=Intoshia linei TaxID=1819745 RepID=A0A177AXD6_9BILA|nr:hypothetical protein A3Q56_06438 [Intoshia linei]
MKDVYYKHTQLQKTLREITTNDDTAPVKQKYLMEMERASYTEENCTEIIVILESRLKDSGKKWRHVKKALDVLFHLLIFGGIRIRAHFQKKIDTIEHLTDFSLIINQKDVGQDVRKQVSEILQLLRDDSKLESERHEAQNHREKYDISKV